MKVRSYNFFFTKRNVIWKRSDLAVELNPAFERDSNGNGETDVPINLHKLTIRLSITARANDRSESISFQRANRRFPRPEKEQPRW